MADISKTIAIIFEGQDNTSSALGAVEEKLKGIEGAAGDATPKLDSAQGAIDKLGTNAGTANTTTRDLGEGLKKLAGDAGVPEPGLKAIDGIMARMGAVGTGTAVLAAAAVAAFGIAAFSSGKQVGDFRTLIENTSGSSEKAEEALKFVRQAVLDLETSLGDTLDLYGGYLQKLVGTDIDKKTSEDAFLGISAAVKGVGGDFKDTKKALENFIEAAKDGDISVKDLDDRIKDLPGAMRLFSEALDVPIEDLYKLAENGKLGKDEIALLAEALRNEDFGSLTPVKDAFTDLWNTIKDLALEIGAETGFTAVVWLAEKAIRGVTLAVQGGVAFVELFGKTLGNIAYTIANLDFEGFGERQDEIWGGFESRIESASTKFFGFDKKVGEASGAQQPAKDYQALADGIGAAGDEAEPATPKIKALKEETERTEKANRDAAKAVAEAEKEIRLQAETAEKAEQAARDWALEMEKIASNERIKTIEANVSLNIAELEENTKRIEAAFASIDNTISASSSNISDLFGMFKDVSSIGERWDLQDQIAKENKLRDEAFKLQKALTEEQIKYLQNANQRMAKGDALIKVDGAGLQPHLEALMWEILKTVQVRVNSQGLSMLLGV